MTLPNVALGDPHVSAHNDERSAINALQDAVETSTLNKVDRLSERTPATAVTGPLWRSNFVGTLASTMSNVVEHWQGSRLVAWANEWGAARFRPGYTGYADAGVRFIIEPDDFTGTSGGGGAAIEIVDRRIPDGPDRKRWRRMWEDGSLQRNGITMNDSIVLADSESVPVGLPINTIVIFVPDPVE